MLKAVIFDMDGVLIDSEPIHYQANKEIMSEFGFELPYEYYKHFIGSTLTYMWDTLKKKHGIINPIPELNHMSESRSKEITDRDGYIKIDGANELVKMFKENGMKLAVASSSAQNIIEEVINGIELNDCFTKLVSGNSVKNPKPAPDVFLKAAAELGVEPSKCLVIEDSANGVNAAKAAGMTCVGFINPNSGNQDLSNADYLVESFVNLDMSFFEMVHCHNEGTP